MHAGAETLHPPVAIRPLERWRGRH
jgi:hypothetical protein